LNKDKSPSYKIGTSDRKSIVDKILRDIPGPGNYSQSALFGNSGPSFSMKGKQEAKQKNEVPGPGNYEP
jgi:hypothetical protein